MELTIQWMKLGYLRKSSMFGRLKIYGHCMDDENKGNNEMASEGINHLLTTVFFM